VVGDHGTDGGEAGVRVDGQGVGERLTAVSTAGGQDRLVPVGHRQVGHGVLLLGGGSAGKVAVRR
jgi:hypothetical protein